MAYRRTANVELRLADNRNRILAAARALVSEGGWPEAQVSHVAAAAGLATLPSPNHPDPVQMS